MNCTNFPLKTMAAFLSLAVTASANAQGTQTPSHPTDVMESHAKVISSGDLESTTLSFTSGQTQLTEAEKKSIREAIENARAEDHQISEIKIASWSDKAHPLKGSLEKKDRDMARQRAENVKKYIKEQSGMGRIRMDTFNMAESANWLARLFNTQEAELDATFAKKGSEAEIDNPQFQVIRDQGGASKVVVVIEHKMKK